MTKQSLKTDKRMLQILNWNPCGMSRGSLVKLSGLSRSTVYDSLIRLEEKNKVESHLKKKKTRGRSKNIWRKLPDGNPKLS